MLSRPPATRTLPLASSVALAPRRAVIMLPVAVHVPVLGSYSSALERVQVGSQGPKPPATKTFPLGSSVAVCSTRAVLMLAVAVHMPVLGSYSSALERSLGPVEL